MDNRIVIIGAGPIGLCLIEWYAMERGSDEHIAVLEQIVTQMQATLAELKAQRAARAP